MRFHTRRSWLLVINSKEEGQGEVKMLCSAALETFTGWCAVRRWTGQMGEKVWVFNLSRKATVCFPRCTRRRDGDAIRSGRLVVCWPPKKEFVSVWS